MKLDKQFTDNMGTLFEGLLQCKLAGAIELFIILHKEIGIVFRDQRDEVLPIILAAAVVRSGMDATHRSEKGYGLFDIPGHIYDEMTVREKYNSNQYNADVRVQIHLALQYLKWGIKQFTRYTKRTDTALFCALAALDGGYYKIEKAVKPLRDCDYFSILHALPCEAVAKPCNIYRIAGRLP